MPNGIQYLPLRPEHAVLVVVAIPPLSFLWKLNRSIRAGETELRHVAWFWCALLCAIAAFLCTTILLPVAGPIAWLPLTICVSACAYFAPAALRNWSKDPWEKARKKSLHRSNLPFDGGRLLLITSLVTKSTRWGLNRPKKPKLKWVKAGKLNMNAVRGLAISAGIGFVWFNLWFMVDGLMQFGIIGFLPGPACLIAVIVFWNRLYSEKFLVEETSDGKAPEISLGLGVNDMPPLAKLPMLNLPPRPAPDATTSTPVRFGKIRKA